MGSGLAAGETSRVKESQVFGGRRGIGGVASRMTIPSTGTVSDGYGHGYKILPCV
jgi:hypothetical protein